MSMIDHVLSLAAKEVGVHEDGGNNRGKRVEEYLSCVGLGPGNPWCAAFVSWVLKQAGIEGSPCSGDTWAIEAWGNQHGCLYNESIHKPEAPQVGDIFLLLGPDNRPRHTGFVAGIEGNRIATIEGNTSAVNAADGDGVEKKSHRIYDCSFVRWAQVCTESKPPTRLVKIFRKPSRAIVVIDGVEYNCRSLSVNGSAPEAGSEISIIAEY